MHNIQSPRLDDDAVEQLIQARGLTAPRVMPADLEANIAHVEYVKHITHSSKVLRWCVITARNGFAVTGDPSASVSPENDNQEVGERVALKNAKDKLWAFLGFELATHLTESA